MRRVHPESLALRRALLATGLLATGLLGSCGSHPMPPDVQGKLDKAVQELAVYSFDNAYPLFKAAMAQAPEGTDAWQQAAYGTAVCLQQMMPASESSMGESSRLYQQLITRTPTSKYAPRATLNLGRIAELPDYYGDKPDLPKAREYYQQAIATWPHDAIAGEATLRLAGTYIQTYDEPEVKKGTALLADWLKAHPNDPLASGMWQYLGDTCFYPLQDYRQSLAAYEQCEKLGWVQKGRQGAMYWRMATMAEKLLTPPDRTAAVTYYTRIITHTPTSGKAYEAQLALKRLGVEHPPAIKLGATTQTAQAPGMTDTSNGGAAHE